MARLRTPSATSSSTSREGRNVERNFDGAIGRQTFGTRDARDAAREAAAFQGKGSTTRIFARGRSPTSAKPPW